MMRDSEQSILPLINIVFLLLIFFMVVGHLAPVDELVEEPLESVAGQEPTAKAGGSDPLTLQMAADGRLALEGIELEEEELLEALSREPQGVPRSGEPGLWFNVDGRAEAAMVIRLMNRMSEAGVPDVRLLTLRIDLPGNEAHAEDGALAHAGGGNGAVRR